MKILRMPLPATLAVIGGLANFAIAAAQDRGMIQDGPAGYTMACAIHKAAGVPDVRPCAELGAAQRCEHESELASHASREQTSMTIVNRSGQPVKLYWLTFSGIRRFYGVVEAGGRLVQPSFIGHNWVVTTTNGECIGILNAAPISIAFF